MKIKISSNLKRLVGLLGKEVYLVGGCVRNSLLNLPIYDIDIASPLSIEQIFERLDGSIYNVKIRSAKMGTVEIFVGEEVYQHTTFRADSYNLLGTHTPTATSFVLRIEQDATRRDFTANCIYYNIASGKVYDKYNGIADINARTLRCIEDADKVFREDGLRLLRLVRFATELKFNVAQDTLENAKKHARNLYQISGERKRQELEQILNANSKYYADASPIYGIKLLFDLNLIQKIFKIEKHKWNFEDYDFTPLNNSLPQNLQLACFILCIFEALNKRQKFDFDKFISVVSNKTALNFSNKETLHISKLVKAFSFRGEVTNARKYIIKNISVFEDLLALLVSFNDIELANTLSAEFEVMQKEKVPLTLKDLKINGNDLVKLGVQNVNIGTTLKKLFNTCVFNPKLNTKPNLLNLAQELIQK